LTPHVKIYFSHYGYCQEDNIVCENCGVRLAVDIHHIVPRSKFGKKRKDEQDKIENLIALCRQCHDKAHSNELTKEQLYDRKRITEATR
jgi:5-methylcytosine-specific restriction endonuclease McrA